MHWDGVGVSDHDKQQQVKLIKMSVIELWWILLYTAGKKHWCVAVLCVSFECVDGTPSTLHWHKNLKCWQMCLCVLNCVSHFFLLSFFVTAIHYSSSHSPNEHTTTWIYTHSLIVPTQMPYLSQKANSRNACQMRRLHMMVSLIIDKKHESMKDVKMMTSNNTWNTLYNDYFAD